MTNDKTLQHVGVLGMHWGIRKARPNSSDAARTSNRFNRSLRQKYGVEVFKKPTPKSNASADHQKVAGLRKKRLSEMSNEELSVLTKRLQLEKSYKELSKTDLSAGQKFLSETLQATGKQLASKYLANVTESAGKLILEALKNKFNKP